MPRGVYPRNKPGNPAPVQDTPDDVLYPVEGNPSACPGPICSEHFESGWPQGSTSVGCEHGMWIRREPIAPVDF